MKGKKFLWSFLTVIMLLSMTVGSALAEDGVLFRRNISKTPENETEKAAIYMMDFYVPAQKSTGELTPVVYPTTLDLQLAYADRNYAKPLVSVYIDDLHPVEETKGGITFGHFDAFVGVSLDDGTTWKTTNLSQSSDLSSFNLQPDMLIRVMSTMWFIKSSMTISLLPGSVSTAKAAARSTH